MCWKPVLKEHLLLRRKRPSVRVCLLVDIVHQTSGLSESQISWWLDVQKTHLLPESSHSFCSLGSKRVALCSVDPAMLPSSWACLVLQFCITHLGLSSLLLWPALLLLCHCLLSFLMVCTARASPCYVSVGYCTAPIASVACWKGYSISTSSSITAYSSTPGIKYLTFPFIKTAAMAACYSISLASMPSVLPQWVTQSWISLCWDNLCVETILNKLVLRKFQHLLLFS